MAVIVKNDEEIIDDLNKNFKERGIDYLSIGFSEFNTYTVRELMKHVSYEKAVSMTVDDVVAEHELALRVVNADLF